MYGIFGANRRGGLRNWIQTGYLVFHVLHNVVGFFAELHGPILTDGRLTIGKDLVLFQPILRCSME